MSKELQARFEKFENWLEELVVKWEEIRELEQYKKDVAKVLVGMPYYWGEYSGVIEASVNPKKVVAHLVNQRTGHECYWTFDSLRVLEHMEEIQDFNSWEEYNEAQMNKWRKEGILV